MVVDPGSRAQVDMRGIPAALPLDAQRRRTDFAGGLRQPDAARSGRSLQGEDYASAARSPHLDYFRHDIEVLYLADPVDGYMTAMLHEAEGKRLQNVDDAGLKLPETPAEEESAAQVEGAAFDALAERFKATLGDRVLGVQASKQLVTSPCRLVSPEDDFDRDLERLRRLMEEGYEAPKKLLELNPRHPMLVDLAQMVEASPDDPLIDAAIEQLFDNALLLEGLHANPVDMVERIQMLMAAAVAAKGGAHDAGSQEEEGAV